MKGSCSIMADELSDEELDALLKAARQPRNLPKAQNLPAASPQSYDFKQPQQLKKEQSRTLETLHEFFARNVAATLATTMRLVVDVELAFTDQALYNEFVLSLPNPCSAYRFSMTPPAGPAILSIAPQLLMAIIDRALGGPGTSIANLDRPLTQIETNITKKFILRLFNDLESAWDGAVPLRVGDIQQETNPEFLQLAAPGDSMVIIGLEAHSNRVSGLIHLCYPLNVVEQLMPKLGPRQRPKSTKPAAQSRRPLLEKIEIPAIIQLAHGSLPLEELAALKPGDVIRLDTTKDDPAVVYLDDRPKFLGRPGLTGAKRAVQIIQAIDTQAEEEHL